MSTTNPSSSLTRSASMPTLPQTSPNSKSELPSPSGIVHLSEPNTTSSAFRDRSPVTIKGREYVVRLWEKDASGVKRYLQFDAAKITNDQLQNMATRVMGVAGEGIKAVSVTFADNGPFAATKIKDDNTNEDFQINDSSKEVFESITSIKNVVNDGLTDGSITATNQTPPEYPSSKPASKSASSAPKPGTNSIKNHSYVFSVGTDTPESLNSSTSGISSEATIKGTEARLTTQKRDGSYQQLLTTDLELFWHYQDQNSGGNSKTLVVTDGSLIAAKDATNTIRPENGTSYPLSSEHLNENEFIRKAREIWNPPSSILFKATKPNLLKVTINTHGHFVGLYIQRKANNEIQAYYVDSLGNRTINDRLGITDQELRDIIIAIVSEPGKSTPTLNLETIYTQHQNFQNGRTNGTECGVLQIMYGLYANQRLAQISNSNLFQNVNNPGQINLNAAFAFREKIFNFIQNSQERRFFNRFPKIELGSSPSSPATSSSTGVLSRSSIVENASAVEDPVESDSSFVEIS